MQNKIQITLMDIFYEGGKSEVRSFTRKELAGFKRSNDYKKIISKKKLCTITVDIRFPKFKN